MLSDGRVGRGTPRPTADVQALASARWASGVPSAHPTGRSMITKLTGALTALHDDRARVQAGSLEYELLISEVGRRALAPRLGQEITLHTSHYFEAGAMQSRIVPRLIGFAS